jgi:hypothetical protein
MPDPQARPVDCIAAQWLEKLNGRKRRGQISINSRFQTILCRLGRYRKIHVLRLINADSLLMVEVSPHQLQKHAPDAFIVMRELHTAAKRTALNTEKALDNILSLLGEDDE